MEVGDYLVGSFFFVPGVSGCFFWDFSCVRDGGWMLREGLGLFIKEAIVRIDF